MRSSSRQRPQNTQTTHHDVQVELANELDFLGVGLLGEPGVVYLACVLDIFIVDGWSRFDVRNVVDLLDLGHGGSFVLSGHCDVREGEANVVRVDGRARRAWRQWTGSAGGGFYTMTRLLAPRGRSGCQDNDAVSRFRIVLFSNRRSDPDTILSVGVAQRHSSRLDPFRIHHGSSPSHIPLPLPFITSPRRSTPAKPRM